MRKICVFTGTRAEYGLLKPLLENIQKDDSLELQLVVSGMHLAPEFGLTYREIEKDGFKIDEKIEMLLSSDTAEAISKSIGLGIIGYTDVFNRLRPDISVVLGDRFEALAFAVSSYVQKIPIAHLYGGEATYGVIDEGIRHAITKFSYLHFVSTKKYKKRVIQLGENPNRVFVVGALGIDNIMKMKLLSKEEVEFRLGRRFKKKNLLVTFHPLTLEEKVNKRYFKEILKALDEEEETLLIFTKANADPEGRAINKLIDEYVNTHPEKALVFANMGQLLYLSTMRYVDAVVGNSSSGIIEAPSFKIGTIDIGDRQKGRIKAESVIEANPIYKDIKNALKMLYSKEFQKKLKIIENPYGHGNSAEKIVSILKEYPIRDLKKEFFEITFNY